MNLKEYLFYSGMTAKEMASQLDVTPEYVRHITCGTYRVSKKIARNVEKVTKGIVKADYVMGPPTHPDATKILELSIDS